jgi:hypothetical protein
MDVRGGAARVEDPAGAHAGEVADHRDVGGMGFRSRSQKLSRSTQPLLKLSVRMFGNSPANFAAWKP